jgi:hypothetical protein
LDQVPNEKEASREYLRQRMRGGMRRLEHDETALAAVLIELAEELEAYAD